MMLLPPKAGTCPICATSHDDGMPHNANSLYYQYNFYGKRGRWPTWADALAHCNEWTRTAWRQALEAGGHWTEPDDGEPIADPPAESIRQPVGNINSTGFGPEDWEP